MSALLLASYLWTQVVIPGKTPIGQMGINDKGQTAVLIDDGTSGIYQRGTFRPLPAPPSSCGCLTTAAAINDSGTIVGTATSPSDFSERGFILSGSTYTFFSWPGWDNTEARGIGNQGLVVGYSYSNDFFQSAGFVYDPSTGVFTQVTPGTANASIVQGINRFGRIAGNAIDPSPRRVYGLVSQLAPLNAFGGTQVPFAQKFQLNGVATRARGINDFGIVVGFVARPDGTFAGFVGNDSWGYEMLKPPGSDLPDHSTTCSGINNFGQVACTVGTLDGSTTFGLYIGTPQFQ
jgi:hypothetical protein